jgi:predicted solute-binding protein
MVRLGVVSYLNAVPLVRGLEADPRYELVRDVPSRIAERLHGGEVDLGMIPSIEYAFGDYRAIPGVAIASRGPVGSVRLFHRKPVAELRRVAVDASSRASAALLKVLLRERLGRDPEYVMLAPDVPAMLESADAALAIGDAALYFEGDVASLDLGAEWTRLTGLPFVYAFWAGRPGAASAEDVARLQAALAEGLAFLGEIAASYNGLGAGRAAFSEAYLRERIVYAFGEAEIAGLAEFYRRAHAAGLIPKLPEIDFYGRP